MDLQLATQGGTGTLSLANLAQLIGLSPVTDTVGGFLDRLEGGRNGLVTLLAGLGAMLLGLLLILGVLTPGRERLVSLRGGGREGSVNARRRPRPRPRRRSWSRRGASPLRGFAFGRGGRAAGASASEPSTPAARTPTSCARPCRSGCGDSRSRSAYAKETRLGGPGSRVE